MKICKFKSKCFRKKRRVNDLSFNNMCEEKQKYIYHLYSIIYQLKNQIIILNQTIKQLEIKRDLLEKELNNESVYCPICYENKINCALIPCGHTFCDSCVIKGDHKCALCRKDMHNYLKIYI